MQMIVNSLKNLWRLGLKLRNQATIQARRQIYTRPTLKKRKSYTATTEKLIGISVSTNYSKILPFVLKANIDKLDAWIIVTTRDDHDTVALLAGLEKIHVLYWDPGPRGRKFDLGGGIRKAQKYAYKKYPGSAYLRFDSDICLPQNFRGTLANNAPLDMRFIYGAKRVEFGSLNDYENQENGWTDPVEIPVIGYFQLYFLPLKYRHSEDARVCDLEFRDLFPQSVMLPGLEVSHLGRSGKNFLGTGMAEADFVI